ncbi:MAG: thermonuclease family protein [Acidimicrobiia bacterium]
MGNYIFSENNKTDGVYIDKVIDGDTVVAKFPDGHKETIRLLGIDTPETHHPTKPVGCFGPEAETFTRNTLLGKKVKLEYDVEKKDKYSRTLAFIYLGDKRFNDVLVSQGYAKVMTIEPNTKYSEILVIDQVNAMKNNKGMWGYCTNDN